MPALICIFCKKYIIFLPFSHIFYLTNPDRIRAVAIADDKTHLKVTVFHPSLTSMPGSCRAACSSHTLPKFYSLYHNTELAACATFREKYGKIIYMRKKKPGIHFLHARLPFILSFHYVNCFFLRANLLRLPVHSDCKLTAL